MRVLILGGGAREHALAKYVARSPLCETLFVYPGNYGMSNIAILLTKDKFKSTEDIVFWCTNNAIDLVIVGPENYLADGVTDLLEQQYIKCFGPNKKASALEIHKAFAKNFMHTYDIPTPKFNIFDKMDEALSFINTSKNYNFVVKADGIAGGKGVILAYSKEEAIKSIKEMLVDKKYGTAGETIVIEEMLVGPEISVLAFFDGKSYTIMPSSQDHKKAFDNDIGPNTGGMGAYAPCPFATPNIMEQIRINVFDKVLQGLISENIVYKGVLYAGIMITPDGPKVLEFNCRFGDPETQVILPLLQCDLLEILLYCASGELEELLPLKWDTTHFCTGVVLAAKGYPIQECPDLIVKNIPSLFTRYGDNPYVSSSSWYQIIFDAGTTKLNKKAERRTCHAGRLFTVVGFADTLALATSKAYALCNDIEIGLEIDGIWENAYFFRKDIAFNGIGQLNALKKDESIGQSLEDDAYGDSGVHIGIADKFINDIKHMVKKHYRPEVLSGIGGFSACFDMKSLLQRYTDPILVTSADGVGSKLKVAIDFGKNEYFKNLGIDLVAMTTNDILASGAECLFFLDYIATGFLDPERAKLIVEGIIEGCELAQCSLIGGETAEMPGIYANDDFDLAGFGVGIVERSNLLPSKSAIQEGDIVIGLGSSGFHSNGFSLIRKIIKSKGLKYDQHCPYDGPKLLGECLLTPTIIYHPYVYDLFKTFPNTIKAFAHITGGGLIDNLPRVLPSNLTCTLDADAWDMSPGYAWIQQMGSISTAEMARVFNLGIGGVLIIGGDSSSSTSPGFTSKQAGDAGNISTNTTTKSGAFNMAEKINFCLNELNLKSWIIGEVTKGSTVQITNLENSLRKTLFSNVYYRDLNHSISSEIQQLLLHSEQPKTHQGFKKVRVAVLISGTGSNMKALIEYSKKNEYCVYDVNLVISNKKNAPGLKIASDYGVPTRVIDHKIHSNRESFDECIHKTLQEFKIEFLCLAGFMRILTTSFLDKWKSKVINVHPALLPSFKGLNAPLQALQAGCKITGSTIHYVEPKLDSGPIIAQTPVIILPGDTEESLVERIKAVEHEMYPKTLNQLLKGREN